MRARPSALGSLPVASKWYQNKWQIRRLQDEQAEKPTDTPGYAIATMVQATSVEQLIENQRLMYDVWTRNVKFHKPRNQAPEPIEETDAYVVYAQQMAYQGKEIWK